MDGCGREGGGREGREGRGGGREGGERWREEGRGDRLTYCIVMSHRYTVLHLHYHNGGSTYGGIPAP